MTNFCWVDRYKFCRLAYGTGSHCDEGLHSIFTSSIGSRFKNCCLDSFRINNCCSNDVAAFAKIVNVWIFSDRRHASGSSKFGSRIRYRGQILALLFLNLWSQMIWRRLWHWHYRIVCANIGDKTPRNWRPVEECLKWTHGLNLLRVF